MVVVILLRSGGWFEECLFENEFNQQEPKQQQKPQQEPDGSQDPYRTLLL